jgi:hypothetical protein
LGNKGKVNNFGNIKMRSLLVLVIFVLLLWLICRFFYFQGRKDGIKSQKLKDKAPATGRKKVDSFVVDNENRGSGGDEQDIK